MTMTKTKTQENRVPCPRCQGDGNLPQFSHVEGGICFLCRGRQTVPVSWLRRERVARAKRPEVKGPRLSPEARQLLVIITEQGGEDVRMFGMVDSAGQELADAGLAYCKPDYEDGARYASLTKNGAKSVHKAAYAGLVKLSDDARKTLVDQYGVGVR